MAAAVIYVKDLDAMSTFYATVFAMTTGDPEPADGVCVLDAGAWQLTLVRVPESIAATIDITDPPRRRESAATKLVFEVCDLEATGTAILAAGGQTEIGRRAWRFRGALHRDIIDPEGDVIQLRQRIPA